MHGEIFNAAVVQFPHQQREHPSTKRYLFMGRQGNELFKGSPRNRSCSFPLPAVLFVGEEHQQTGKLVSSVRQNSLNITPETKNQKPETKPETRN